MVLSFLLMNHCKDTHVLEGLNLFFNCLFPLFSIRAVEVLTVPPHSTWIPCGIHVIPEGFHSFHMEYVLGETPPILVFFFHAYSIWNGQIPPGIHGVHMDYPHGFHMEYSTTIPWIPSGFQVDSHLFHLEQWNGSGFQVDSSQ